MTPFDPKWPQVKFDTASLFITSNNIIAEVFMTQAYMSHLKRIFKPKFQIWPQVTPLNLEVTRLNLPVEVMLDKHIEIKKKSKKRSRVPVKIPEKFNFANRFTQKFEKF